MRARLSALEVESLGAGPVVDRQMAQACLAGLWLLHDFLDESHQISQGLETSTGACWHGIMHRREGDFSNAKYWFCRAGVHPVFKPLAERARPLAAGEDAALRFLRNQAVWDPNLFVDLCARSLSPAAPHNLVARQAQRLEWELLFDYCRRMAFGDSARREEEHG